MPSRNIFTLGRDSLKITSIPISFSDEDENKSKNSFAISIIELNKADQFIIFSIRIDSGKFFSATLTLTFWEEWKMLHFFRIRMQYFKKRTNEPEAILGKKTQLDQISAKFLWDKKALLVIALILKLTGCFLLLTISLVLLSRTVSCYRDENNRSVCNYTKTCGTFHFIFLQTSFHVI